MVDICSSGVPFFGCLPDASSPTHFNAHEPPDNISLPKPWSSADASPTALSTTKGNNFTAVATTFEVDNSTEITFKDNNYPETVFISVKNNACFVEGSQLGDAADGTICA